MTYQVHKWFQPLTDYKKNDVFDDIRCKVIK